jgi:hypothetical protein
MVHTQGPEFNPKHKNQSKNLLLVILRLFVKRGTGDACNSGCIHIALYRVTLPQFLQVTLT